MCRALLLLAALGLLAGYAGALHPAGDSFAVLRPAFIATLLLIAPLCGMRWGLTGLTLAGIAAAPILWDIRENPQPKDGLTVYLKNLSFKLGDPELVIADIRASGADIVLLQELSTRNRAVPGALEDTYPHQLICPAHSVGAVGILSRLPFAGPEICEAGSGFAAMPVETQQGPVTVATIHLHWPWPYRQAAQVAALVPQLAALPRPIVIGGDFNMVPWSHTLRRVGSATGTRRIGPLRATLRLKRTHLLPIDHLLAPDGWIGHAETRPELGSDHRGVLVRLSSPAS